LGSEKPVFKKAQPTGFWGFFGFWALLDFWIFYLNKQLGSLLVDLAYQLNLYLDSLVRIIKKFANSLLIGR